MHECKPKVDGNVPWKLKLPRIRRDNQSFLPRRFHAGSLSLLLHTHPPHLTLSSRPHPIFIIHPPISPTTTPHHSTTTQPPLHPTSPPSPPDSSPLHSTPPLSTLPYPTPISTRLFPTPFNPPLSTPPYPTPISTSHHSLTPFVPAILWFNIIVFQIL
ncbi:hypothetical protein Pmani_039221 [Petrolisthes manimaculis]|uniref:Uncharacterized protein n=1 Tax=Petrolisthes manimaculis TaxID=1843537 RepID=A0AAE1NEK3_9EUCA|nr:hypothetical protein Pmani_039221 [Petrolisthes manimaculis]